MQLRDQESYCHEVYRFMRVIGSGAFSKVYLVEDKNGRQFACKVSRQVKMLEREAEMLGRLYHPLFPAYVGYEEEEGAGRLFMEYIPGRSLGQVARLRGGFSPKQTMRIAEELADGLRYLHERQPTVLYRDLKPENILVCENGHIKVIDLGCACYQDEQGEAKVGTPGFAPPEQLMPGETAGIYSDVYGLGKTLKSVIAEEKRRYGIKRTYRSGERKFNNERRKRRNGKRIHHSEEKCCRRRLEHMIELTTREGFRQRPQDMLGVSCLLTGKRIKEGIICEKNIWESGYKNSCSLPSI